MYRDAWKDDNTEKWIAATKLRSPLFCTGNPFWQGRPFQPTCTETWPIKIQFLDGTKYENGSLKTCIVNMADLKYSDNTKNCLKEAVYGFDTYERLDWLVYITAGYKARMLWYHDFAETLIKR